MPRVPTILKGGMLLLAAAALGRAAVVARVDGTPLESEELQLFIAGERAKVAARCFPGVPAVSAAMWQVARQGVTAADTLRQTALRAALQAKAAQLVFQERGLIARLDFESFTAEWNRENQRRRTAAARGEPVYGPLQLSLAGYYRQREARLRLRLAALLRPEMPPPLPEEIERYFHAGPVAPEAAGVRRDEAQARAVLLERASEARAAAAGPERLARAQVQVDAAALAEVPLF